MAIINLTFGQEINGLLQVGDTVFACSPSANGDFSYVTSVDNITKIGTCSSINTSTNSIEVDTGSLSFPLPTSGNFILFSKDNGVNMSSLIGYYAEVKFINNSKTEAELFSVGAQVVESSK